MATTEPRAKTIQSVDRAAALIKAIADSRAPPDGDRARRDVRAQPQHDLAAARDARRHGLIERDPISQRYSLGYAFLRIAAGAEVDPLVRRGRPVLERLAHETGETTNLAVAKRFSLVYVDQVDPPQVMAPNWFGRDVPLHATSTGKAYLAFLSAEEQETVLPRAARALHGDDRHRPQGARRGARRRPAGRLRDLRRRARGVALRRVGAGALRAGPAGRDRQRVGHRAPPAARAAAPRSASARSTRPPR